MRYITYFRSALLFFAAPFLASILLLVAAAQNANNAQVVRLAKVEGAVEVQGPAEPNPAAATINLPLVQGSTLTTERGTASIEWENGATGFVADNSVVEFTELTATPNARITRLTMREGAARFYANAGNADTFAVLTPDVTVFAQQSDDFRVDVYRDGTTVTVLNGQARVGSAGANWTVDKGQTLSMRSGQLQATIAPSPPLDEFDHRSSADFLKQNQDIAAERGYLPPALRGTTGIYGMAELNNYGTWTPLPNYGYGWQPLGVGAGWLPFQNGIWILSPATSPGRTGLFWVSSEPWGWLPFHFGQWLYSPQGWFWIPTTFNNFQAAPVNFVHIGNRLGWVAASPLDQPNKNPVNAARGVLVGPAANGKTQIAGGAPGSSTAGKIPATGGLQAIANPAPSLTRQLATPLAPAKPVTLAGGAALQESLPGSRGTGIVSRNPTGGNNPRTGIYENGNPQLRLRDESVPTWATKPVTPVNQRLMPQVPGQQPTPPPAGRSLPWQPLAGQPPVSRAQPPLMPNPGPSAPPQLPRPYVAPVQPVQQPIQQQQQPRPSQPAQSAGPSSGPQQGPQQPHQPGTPGSVQSRGQQRGTQQDH